MVLPISIGLLMLAAIGSNSMLALAATAVLLIGTSLQWRPGESPILLFVFLYQWLQISVGIFYASWFGWDINEFAKLPGDVQTAAILSLSGLAVLSCGMRWGSGAHRPHAKIVRLTDQRQPVKNFFWLYVVVASITTVLGVLAGIIPGLSQPLLALAGLKWAFFFMLSYATFCLSGFNIYWAIAFAFEVILSFGSYFSDYKTVFFFSVFGLVAAQKRFSGRANFGMTVFAASLLTMSVIWTSIKSDYRHFASGGQAAQVVTVGFDQRMAKLGELVSNLDGAAMRVGL